jgi:uncharacterized protein
MNELAASQVVIQDSFWTPRLLANSRVAILHQWHQLEENRCIDNFRLVTGEKDGFREGWFFADSDAYKWLDAASRIYASWPSVSLNDRMNELILLLSKAQMDDGYLYTYNQIHFPGERWGNLLIEHELYCHGHLIEAGVSHFEATGEKSALKISIKAADLLVSNFLIASPDKTTGHEEVEIALLRLYQITNQKQYLDLASQFLERRGKIRPFAPLIIQQNARVARRNTIVRKLRKLYLARHPEQSSFRLSPTNFTKQSPSGKLRWLLSALTGNYFQQNSPIRNQKVPVGHSVRFTYLETAIAMLYRQTGDSTLLPPLQHAWEHMVTRRMYITGGIGSLPEIEGFGRDYELDPEMAYAETCASLGSLFWNWEMALITKDACYSDLFEMQIYNAAAVGMGLNGDSYLYNNPLLCQGGVTRQPWFQVPCCPSNLSRTWASLGKYIYSFDDSNLWVHQYFGSHTTVGIKKWRVKLASGLPWDSRVRFSLDLSAPADFTVHFRVPSWAKTVFIQINDENYDASPSTSDSIHSSFGPETASGYDPRRARFFPIRRTWLPGDVVDLDFEIPIVLRHASPHLRGHKGKVALTRGPLVYCLESLDNPDIDIFSSRIDPDSISVEFSPALLGGIWILRGKTTTGKIFTAIPYHLWANRGPSQMTVWVNE